MQSQDKCETESKKNVKQLLEEAKRLIQEADKYKKGIENPSENDVKDSVQYDQTSENAEAEIKVNFVEKQSEKSENVLIFFKDCDEFLTVKCDQLSQKIRSKIQNYCFDVEDSRIASLLLINDKYIILDSFTEVIPLGFINLEKKIALINSYSNTQKSKLILDNKFNYAKEAEYFNSRNIFEINKMNFYKTLKEDSSKTDCNSLIEKINIDNSILDNCSNKGLAKSLPGSLYILKNIGLMDILFSSSVIDSFVNSISEIERTMNVDQGIYLEGERLEKMCYLFQNYNSAIPSQFTNFNLVFLPSSIKKRTNNVYEDLNLKIKNEIIKLIGEKFYNAIDWNTVYFSGGSLLNIIQRVIFGRDYPMNADQDIDLLVNRKEFKQLLEHCNSFGRLGSNTLKYISIETKRIIEYHLTSYENVKVINNFEFMFQRCFWKDHKLFISPLALFGLFNQINFQYSSTRMIKFGIMSKYIERGYKFIVNDIEAQKIKTLINNQGYKISKCVI